MRYWGVILAIVLVSSGRAHGEQCYTYEQVDIENGSGTIGTTVLEDVNNGEILVGDFTDSNPPFGYVVEKKGRIRSIGIRGSSGVVVKGINNLGAVVGWYGTLGSGVPLHGFYRDRKGKVTTLDVPGALFTEAVGVNDLGMVVGDYRDGQTGNFRGFVWDGGGFVTVQLPVVGLVDSGATGINTNRQVVGSYSDATGSHGFVWHVGLLEILTAPDGSALEPQDITNGEEIVGNYTDVQGDTHGFVLTAAREFTQVDVPFSGAVFTTVWGASDAGEIVGGWFDGAAQHGFLATPVGCAQTQAIN